MILQLRETLTRLGGSLLLLHMTLLVAASPASAALITNGDFEADPFDTGWGNTAATETTGLYSSAQAAEFTTATTGRVSQAFSPLTDFVVEFDFSPTVASGSRKLNVVLYSDPNTGTSDAGASLNIRSDINGDLQVFSGGWATVANGAKAFTVGNEYMLRIVGNDIGGTSAYDLLYGPMQMARLSITRRWDSTLFRIPRQLQVTAPSRLFALVVTVATLSITYR